MWLGHMSCEMRHVKIKLDTVNCMKWRQPLECGRSGYCWQTQGLPLKYIAPEILRGELRGAGRYSTGSVSDLSSDQQATDRCSGR